MRLFNDKGHGPWSKTVFAKTSEDCKFSKTNPYTCSELIETRGKGVKSVQSL